MCASGAMAEADNESDNDIQVIHEENFELEAEVSDISIVYSILIEFILSFLISLCELLIYFTQYTITFFRELLSPEIE